MLFSLFYPMSCREWTTQGKTSSYHFSSKFLLRMNDLKSFGAEQFRERLLMFECFEPNVIQSIKRDFFNFPMSKLIFLFVPSRPMNPPPSGAWRGSDDNGYISAEPSPGLYRMVSMVFSVCLSVHLF